jgi:hypothetical protein
LFWGTATDERCQFFLLTFHFPLLFFVLASELFSGGVDRPREVERFKGVNLKTVTIKSPGVQALLCSAKKKKQENVVLWSAGGFSTSSVLRYFPWPAAD